MLSLFVLFLFVQISYGNTQPTNHWKMAVYPFVNKTEKGREANLTLVIQNSIKTFLSKVDYLDVNIKNAEKTSMRGVFNDAYTNGYDIVVNGSYAVIGDKIYIYVSVYDVLQRLLKFENSYSGNAGQDIFDTLDVIIENLRQDVTKAVKPMDEETLVKYRKRVELVSDDIKLNRSFVTTLGINSSFNDHFTWLPFMGLEIRLGSVYFGFSSFMPLLVNNELSLDNWKNNLSAIFAGYRLWNITAGAGLAATFSLVTIRSYPGNNYVAYQITPAFLAPMAFVKYDFSPEFSLKASFAMNFLNSEMLIGNDIAEPHRSIAIPIVNLGLDYYFQGNWGIKLDFYYSSFSESFQTINGVADFKGGNTLLLVGVNYRVDFY
jgi:TolB-like protein